MATVIPEVSTATPDPRGQRAGIDRVIAALPKVVDEAMRNTISGYTPELAAQVAETAIGLLTGTICPVYRDCADTIPGHYDHYTHDPKVTGDDGSTILEAGMVANSGSDQGAIVYLRNTEFTDAASVRAKTAEVRAFLDEVDGLADRVFADQQARTEQVAAEHPHMRPVLKPTNVCVYEGGPAVTVRTGKLGNRYGLCASCRDSEDRTDIAVRIMEPFRTRLGDAGLLDDRVEEFIDKVIVIASVAEDPEARIAQLFQMILDERDSGRAEDAGATA